MWKTADHGYYLIVQQIHNFRKYYEGTWISMWIKVLSCISRTGKNTHNSCSAGTPYPRKRLRGLDLSFSAKECAKYLKYKWWYHGSCHEIKQGFLKWNFRIVYKWKSKTCKYIRFHWNNIIDKFYAKMTIGRAKYI